MTKVSELTGDALDWAVASCEGYKLETYNSILFICLDEAPHILQRLGHSLDNNRWQIGYSPSSDWSQGGPIVERSHITVSVDHSGVWIAYSLWNYADEKRFMRTGETPLIAAMRCYVASKLGDDIELPKELQ